MLHHLSVEEKASGRAEGRPPRCAAGPADETCGPSKHVALPLLLPCRPSTYSTTLTVEHHTDYATVFIVTIIISMTTITIRGRSPRSTA